MFSWNIGTLYCTHCPNFPTKCQNDLNYHIANKKNARKLDVIFKCKLCYQEFPGFYFLRQHKNTQHGFPIKTENIDPEDIINEIDDARSHEQLRSCQHFLVDSELERARHTVFNYAIENLSAKIVDEKREHFFNNLKCAAKVKLPFRFILWKKEGALR